MRYISPEGIRQDVSHCYIHPRLQDGKHPNLHILVESQVIRVVFEQQKAVGVEFRPNPRFHDSTLTQRVRARKMVIISCGALATPSVLERSGIGSAEVLSSAGVDLVSEIPGVGDGYQDHHLLCYPYRTSLEEHETLDSILNGRVSPSDLLANNDPRLGWNTQDVTAKLRPTDADVVALGPEFQAAWDKDFKNKPDKPLAMIGLVSG
jgi:alcohol oxidase